MAVSSRTHVFLNIEGVLVKPGSAHLILRGENDDWASLWCWADGFTELCEEYDLALVLRTSWLLQMSIKDIVQAMPPRLANRVVGATEPIAELTFSGARRVAYQYDVIRKYVKRRRLSTWCAIDDREENWPDTERWRLFRPHPTHGLAARGALKALRALIEQTRIG